MNHQLFIDLLNPLMAGTFAVMFGCLWARVRRTYLLFVSLGFLASTVLYLTQSFMPLGHPGANILLIHLALLGSVLGFSCAAILRVRRPVPVGLYIGVSALFLAVTCWFLFVTPSLVTRIHVTNASMMVILLIAAIWQWPARKTFADDALIVLSAFSALFYAWRSIALYLIHASDGSFLLLRDSTYGTIVELVAVFLSALTAVAYIVALSYELYDELSLEARTDKLSGLLNRRGFEQAAKAWLLGNRDKAAILLLADIDHFKSINDTFGHSAGDRAIRRFSGILRVVASDAYVIGRIGGEEFAILIPEASAHEARAYVDIVRQRLAGQSIAGLPDDFRFTVSFGACTRMPSDDLSDLLNRADRALYGAKADGRDTMRVDLGAVVTAR